MWSEVSMLTHFDFINKKLIELIFKLSIPFETEMLLFVAQKFNLVHGQCMCNDTSVQGKSDFG